MLRSSQLVRVRCPVCRKRPQARGVLCAACAETLGGCDGLLPEHLSSTATIGQGWLVDIWGQPHPVARDGTVVGRAQARGLAIFQHSVSRQHAEVSEQPTGWEVRDFGSKNGTLVARARIHGRGPLAHGDPVQFGNVPFYFLAELDEPPAAAAHAILTASATTRGVRSRLLRQPDGAQELQLVHANGHGVLLFRASPTDDWHELDLAPLELELLCVLVDRRRAARLEVEAHVMTKELAEKLSFRSHYANEENVRQLVKRLRVALGRLGVTDLIGSVPRRGYSLTWVVEREGPSS